MVTYPLSNHHRFLHTPSRQPISLCLVEGVMMGQDDRIDDRAAIETTPAGEFMPRRAQFKIIIPFSNHQPITTLTGHMAPPSPGVASATSHVERSFHNMSKKEIGSIQDREPGLRCLRHHLRRRSG